MCAYIFFSIHSSNSIFLKPQKAVCHQLLEAHCCPKNWTRIEDSCYFISDEKLNITQAEEKCNDLTNQGKLFEPKTLHQNDLVHTLLKTTKGIRTNEHYFIGINDRTEEGR